MSDPTQPDGRSPARPPRFDERSAGQHNTEADATVTSDATPQRLVRPNDPDAQPFEQGQPTADPTVVYAPGASTNQPGQRPAGQYPATGPRPGAAVAPPPWASGPGNVPAGPVGPGFGGTPPAGGPPYGGPGGSHDQPKKKKSGVLVVGLIALVLALVGAVAFVALQATGDDEAEPVSTDDEPEPTVETTQPEATSSSTEEATTTAAVATGGSVDSLFVHLETFPDVVAEGDLDATLQRIGLSDGNNPVSSVDPVLNLCAAIPVAEPVMAAVAWTVDDISLFESAERLFVTPADGNCINNSGEPFADGVYEVSFTDTAGSMSGVALFTVGAETVNQEFLNDTGADLCAVELAPTAAGFFQSFEVNGGEPLVPGDSILIDVADVEHEVRGVDCDGAAAESFTASPGPDPISLASGAALPPATTEPPPPPQITDGELSDVNGEIGSLAVAVENESTDEQAVIDVLLDPETSLRIATDDPSLALCAAWDLVGPIDAEMVWEFNSAVIARFPLATDGGRVGRCIPPGGAEFDVGAYQAYIERSGVKSEVETFTVGRAQTQLEFRNDTGVAVCRVGFSPNLTNWYTFYEFAESSDFDESVAPGDSFTIVAPFIENDIRAFDCDGNAVAESTDIPPTDQTLNLSTGRP